MNTLHRNLFNESVVAVRVSGIIRYTKLSAFINNLCNKLHLFWVFNCLKDWADLKVNAGPQRNQTVFFFNHLKSVCTLKREISAQFPPRKPREGGLPSHLFLSNVLSPMSWTDGRRHVWQWLTEPVIAVFALGDEQTAVVGPRVWNMLPFLNYLEIQLWILHYHTQWTRPAGMLECC